MEGLFSKYDNYGRNGTAIFIGEYGTHVNGCCDGSPASLGAGLGDAIFLTGMERNADLVQMIAYAPMFKREGQEQWNPGIPAAFFLYLLTFLHVCITLSKT